MGQPDQPKVSKKPAVHLLPESPLRRRPGASAERSRREDQKGFYSCHSFGPPDDFADQHAIHSSRANNFPMRPLDWSSPSEFAVRDGCEARI